MTLHVIIASHNRRELTVRAVERAAESASRSGLSIRFVVYDDGSSDGTADALRAMTTPVTVLEGDGTAFWAASMSVAEEHAMRGAGDGDWIVWMNDDILIDLDALDRVRPHLSAHPQSVFVASFREPGEATISYGGYRRISRVHPLRVTPTQPGDEIVPIDTMNGNLVFVPVSVVGTIGGIDGSFAHAAADTDFGLRCRRQGVPLLLLPGTYGSCARNPVATGSRLSRWRAFTGPKGGGHPATLRRILRKHAPLHWPLLWSATYGLWWARQARSGARRSNGPAHDRYSNHG